MKKFFATLIIGLLLIPSVHANETEPVATESHLGAIVDVTISKKWNPVNVAVIGGIFTLGNYIERAIAVGTVEVDIIPTYLKAQVLGYYFYYGGNGAPYTNHLRYQIGLGGGVPIDFVSLAWSARFESTYTLEKPDSAPLNRIRPKVRCSFKIPQSAWTPFAEVEYFLNINGKSPWHTDRLWYNIGVTYAINKQHLIELKVREEQKCLSTPRQWNTYIGFGYKVTL